MNGKYILVYGGGTISHVRNHLALCAPAYGGTARKLVALCNEIMPEMQTHLFLTKMADPKSSLETNDDVKSSVKAFSGWSETKIVFFSCAMCDVDGQIGDVESGKYAERLQSREIHNPAMSVRKGASVSLKMADKVIGHIRNTELGGRKDVFLVGFKTTCGATEDEQYIAGLNLLKGSSCNLVLANDTKTRVNMVITPEEARYHVTQNREEALRGLVEMTKLRSHLTFTRSTVVAGEPVPWNSEQVPSALRTVVDYCIERGAYKPFRGATVGHFAAKIGPTTFLTSQRKKNFNELAKIGLVRIETDGPDRVIAYGAKPSVGGQSQRIVFSDHPDCDCIVHAHVPIRPGSKVPVISQREYECGSHECGNNTSKGLEKFGNLYAVYLDDHGPNIVFNKDIDPQEVIDFIEDNFDLSEKTGGPVSLEAVEAQLWNQ